MQSWCGVSQSQNSSVISSPVCSLSRAKPSVANRNSMVPRLDELLLAFSDDDFLVALPAMRLAFSFFPPRDESIT